MTDNLFDPSPFTVGTPRSLTPRKAKPAVEVVPVVVDRIWMVVNGKQPGIVHAALEGPTGLGYYTTFCGLGGGGRTLEPGVMILGCAACAAKRAEAA